MGIVQTKVRSFDADSRLVIPAVYRRPPGGPMQGVEVIATSLALSRPVSTVTDERGAYALSDLPPGTYRVAFRSPTTAEVQREGVEVRPRRTTPVFVTMWISEPIAPP